MMDSELKMKKVFELSDLIYFREIDKTLSNLGKDLSRISREFNIRGMFHSSIHVNKIFDKRMEIINHKGKHYLKTETGYREVLATTDKSLKMREYNSLLSCCKSKEECHCILPQPSQSFIEAFVEAYNKGQQITEVMVECETVTDWDNYTTIPVGNGGATHKEKQQLKINPKDNTITIRKVKDSWTIKPPKDISQEDLVDMEYYLKDKGWIIID